MDDRLKILSKRFLVFGAVSAGIGVGCGAFGAHGLKSILAPEMLGVFETGVRYQMYHAFGLLAVGLVALMRAPLQSRALEVAGWCFLVGTVLFSGSLYLLSLTGAGIFGVVTPFGGVAFLAGWGALTWSVARMV